LLDSWVLIVQLIMLSVVLGHVSDGNLSLFGRDCTVLLTYFFNLIIEGSLLIQIPDLIPVSLVLKVLPLFGGHGLPLLAYFLHNLERAHFCVLVHNLRSRLQNG